MRGMTWRAKPTNIKWLGVVVMMRLRFFITAIFAGESFKKAYFDRVIKYRSRLDFFIATNKISPTLTTSEPLAEVSSSFFRIPLGPFDSPLATFNLMPLVIAGLRFSYSDPISSSVGSFPGESFFGSHETTLTYLRLLWE